MTKLQLLTNLEGFESTFDMIEAYVLDSVSPGICKNAGCDYTTEVEPDCTSGWCEACNSNTVVSAMILAGVI